MNARLMLFAVATTSSLLGMARSAGADNGIRSNGDAKSEPNGLSANVHINLLGVLIFGVTAGPELGASHWGVGARARWINSGLYARAKLPANDDESLAFSYGGGVGARYYSATQGPLTGFFVGPAFEVAHTRLENQRASIATVTSLAIPEVEAGFRWRVGPWLFDLGAAAGYAVVLSKSVEDINGGHNSAIYANSATNTVYGSVLGDVGIFF